MRNAEPTSNFDDTASLHSFLSNTIINFQPRQSTSNTIQKESTVSKKLSPHLTHFKNSQFRSKSRGIFIPIHWGCQLRVLPSGPALWNHTSSPGWGDGECFDILNSWVGFWRYYRFIRASWWFRWLADIQKVIIDVESVLITLPCAGVDSKVGDDWPIAQRIDIGSSSHSEFGANMRRRGVSSIASLISGLQSRGRVGIFGIQWDQSLHIWYSRDEGTRKHCICRRIESASGFPERGMTIPKRAVGGNCWNWCWLTFSSCRRHCRLEFACFFCLWVFLGLTKVSVLIVGCSCGSGDHSNCRRRRVEERGRVEGSSPFFSALTWRLWFLISPFHHAAERGVADVSGLRGSVAELLTSWCPYRASVIHPSVAFAHLYLQDFAWTIVLLSPSETLIDQTNVCWFQQIFFQVWLTLNLASSTLNGDEEDDNPTEGAISWNGNEYG